jgi:hypothetical protein
MLVQTNAEQNHLPARNLVSAREPRQGKQAIDAAFFTLPKLKPGVLRRSPCRIGHRAESLGARFLARSAWQHHDRFLKFHRISHFTCFFLGDDFGTAHALCQGMLNGTTQTKATSHPRFRTREEVRELLEGLRAAYQSLSPSNRAAVKSAIEDSRPVEGTYESEEKQCFELAC